MTKFGEYITKRSINKASVSRKTGINKNRLTTLSQDPDARIKADELYLIALAIEADPCELLKYVCGDLQLKAILLFSFSYINADRSLRTLSDF